MLYFHQQFSHLIKKINKFALICIKQATVFVSIQFTIERRISVNTIVFRYKCRNFPIRNPMRGKENYCKSIL